MFPGPPAAACVLWACPLMPGPGGAGGGKGSPSGLLPQPSLLPPVSLSTRLLQPLLEAEARVLGLLLLRACR